MTFQSVPDTAEIVLIGTMGGQEIINTFFGNMDGGYAIADIEALANAVDSWAGSFWRPQMPSNYTYNRTEVRGLNSAIDLTASAAAEAGVGALAASSFSNNSSLAIKRSSGFTGRGARGRIFIPPPSTAGLVDANHISDAFAATLVGVLDALDTAIADVGFLPVIVHRVEAGVPLATAVVFTLVEWVVINTVIDSMRRRLPGRGV